MAVTQVGAPGSPVVQIGSLTPSVLGVWSGTQPRTAGDLLIACVTDWGQVLAGAISTPAGWTLGPTITAAAAPQSEVAIFTRIATGADAAPTFSATNTGTATSSRMVVELFELTGGTSVGASGTVAATASVLALNIATSGNVPASGCYAIAAWIIGNTVAAAVTFTSGAGFTNVTNDGAGSTRSHTGFDTDATPASGSTLTDALTWTTTTSSAAAGAIIVVQPGAVLATSALAGAGIAGSPPAIGVTDTSVAAGTVVAAATISVTAQLTGAGVVAAAPTIGAAAAIAGAAAATAQPAISVTANIAGAGSAATQPAIALSSSLAAASSIASLPTLRVVAALVGAATASASANVTSGTVSITATIAGQGQTTATASVITNVHDADGSFSSVGAAVKGTATTSDPRDGTSTVAAPVKVLTSVGGGTSQSSVQRAVVGSSSVTGGSPS